jgi:hypothetical protein
LRAEILKTTTKTKTTTTTIIKNLINIIIMIRIIIIIEIVIKIEQKLKKEKRNEKERFGYNFDYVHTKYNTTNLRNNMDGELTYQNAQFQFYKSEKIYKERCLIYPLHEKISTQLVTIPDTNMIMPRDFIVGIDEQLIDRVVSTYERLINAGHSISKIRNNKGQQSITVFSNNNKPLFDISYGVEIRKKSIDYQYRYPVHPEIYEKIIERYPSYKKYGLIVSPKNSNQHYRYHSARGLCENTCNLDLMDRFVGYLRITFGENICRSGYMAGVHFLDAMDRYDEIRIDKYLNNSYTPRQNILKSKFNERTLTALLNSGGLETYRNSNYVLITSTDAIYYQPDLAQFCNIPDNNVPNIGADPNQQNINRKRISQRHIFNVFSTKLGMHVIDENVKYHIRYETFLYDRDGLFYPQPRDEFADRPFDNEFHDYSDPNISNMVFQQGHYYYMLFVWMKVEGNPKPYVHPFPIFNGRYISVEYLNNVPVIMNDYETTVYTMYKLHKDLYYVDMMFDSNIAEGDENFVEFIDVYDLTKPWVDKSKFQVQLEVSKFDFTKVQSKEISQYNKEDFVYSLMDGGDIYDDGKVKMCSEFRDLFIFKGDVYKLKKNKINIDNWLSFFETEHYLERNDIEMRIPKEIMNMGILHFRNDYTNQSMIKSCASSLVRFTNNNEKYKELTVFESMVIAQTCSQIALVLNLINIDISNRQNEKINKINADLNIRRIKEKTEEFAGKVKELVPQVFDVYDKCIDTVQKREKNEIRKMYYREEDDNIDNFISKVKSLNDNAKNFFNKIVNNKDYSISGIFNKTFNFFNQKINEEISRQFYNHLFNYKYTFIVLMLLFGIFSVKLSIFSMCIALVISLCNNKQINKKYINRRLCRNYYISILLTQFINLIIFIFLVLIPLNLSVNVVTLISKTSCDIANALSFLFTCVVMYMSYNSLIKGDFFSNLFSLLNLVLFAFRYNQSNLIIENLQKLYVIVEFIFNLCFFDTLSYIYAFVNIFNIKNFGVNAFNVLEPGTCTINDISKFITFLRILQRLNKNKTKYDDCPKEIKEKYNPSSYGKVKIINLPRTIYCNHEIEKESQFLLNHNFLINGHYITENKPIKLHKCVKNELESVYRQVQSGIFYEKHIMDEFIKFSQKQIDYMFDIFLQEHQFEKIYLEDYYKKLGVKRKEYKEGAKEYYDGERIKKIFKMHNKFDEKQFVSFVDFKSKSRNICAQLKQGKVLLGIPCELGMQLLHTMKWSGPGNKYSDRCKKFSEWIEFIGEENCSIICCDGSAFDSTQHQIMIEKIDSYFLNKVLDYNPYLSEIFDIQSMKEVINQKSFTIFSPYGYLYTIQGTQLSGRMNTCLSNTIRSSLYVKFIIHKMGIYYDELCQNLVEFEVNGDDQIIFIHSSLVDKYIKVGYTFVYAKEDSNEYHGLGQICKIFDVYENMNGAEYLSCIFLYDKESHKCWLVRKPDRFFQLIPYTFRLGFRNKNKLDFARTKLGYEIITATLLENKGIEIYEKLLNKYLELNQKHMKKLPQMNYRRFLNKVNKRIVDFKRDMEFKCKGDQKFNKRTNELFERFLEEKYGINSDDLLEFLNAIKDVTDIDQEVNVRIIDKFNGSVVSYTDFLKKVELLHKNKTYQYVEDGSPKIHNHSFQHN